MLSSHIGEDASVGASQECQICLNGMISRDGAGGGDCTLFLLHTPGLFEIYGDCSSKETEIVYLEYTIVNINAQTESC
jgi:hypothetical protein